MTGPSRNFKNHQNRYESNNSQSTSEENQMNNEAILMEEAEDHIESPDDILLPERREIYRRRKRKRRFLTIGVTILALIGVIIGTTIYSVRNSGEEDKIDFDVDTASSSETEGEEKLGDLYSESDDGTSPTKTDLNKKVETEENNQEVIKEDISKTQTEEVQQPTDSEIESSDGTTDFPTSSPKASELLPIESTSSIWSEDDIGTLCLPSNIKTSEGRAACNSTCVDMGYEPCCNRDMEDSCFFLNYRKCSKTAGCLVLQGNIVPPPLSNLNDLCKQPISLFPEPQSTECLEACDAAKCCFVDPIEEGNINGSEGLLSGRKDDDNGQNSTLEEVLKYDDNNDALGQSCRLTDELACEQYDICVNRRYEPEALPGPPIDLSRICYSDDAQNIEACAETDEPEALPGPPIDLSRICYSDDAQNIEACAEACSVAICCTDSAELGYLGFGKGDCFNDNRQSCLAHAPCQSLYEDGFVPTAPGNLAELCSQSAMGEDSNIDVPRECKIACGRGACCTSNDNDFNCVNDYVDECIPYIDHCSMVDVFMNLPPPPTDLETACAPWAISRTSEGYWNCKRSCEEAACCDTPNLIGIVGELMSGNATVIGRSEIDLSPPSRGDDDFDDNSMAVDGDDNLPTSTFDDLFESVASDDMKMIQSGNDDGFEIDMDSLRNSCTATNFVGCSFYLPCVSLRFIDEPVDKPPPQSNFIVQRPTPQPVIDPVSSIITNPVSTIPLAPDNLSAICARQYMLWNGTQQCSNQCKLGACCLIDNGEDANCFNENAAACVTYLDCSMLSKFGIDLGGGDADETDDNDNSVPEGEGVKENGGFQISMTPTKSIASSPSRIPSPRPTRRRQANVENESSTLIPTQSVAPISSLPTSIPTPKPTNRWQKNEPVTSNPTLSPQKVLTSPSPTLIPTPKPTDEVLTLTPTNVPEDNLVSVTPSPSAAPLSIPTVSPTGLPTAEEKDSPEQTLYPTVYVNSIYATNVPTAEEIGKNTIPFADLTIGNEVCTRRAVRKDPTECQALCEPSKCCTQSGDGNCFNSDNTDACMSYRDYCFMVAHLDDDEPLPNDNGISQEEGTNEYENNIFASTIDDDPKVEAYLP
eukprot:CAMPEP_0194399664 /NCGR_PEP_ID=MMETSP0174-20130528/126784_1 /TAXON_ID=216777 /ORGANISM="Proboscia alata, Strain PI-D3" /LENGTH=1097 /DNA_ID=CAMNT_0039196095 /DNA_START=17 /DNA_END=3314 /DNA_ORIENTATION=-